MYLGELVCQTTYSYLSKCAVWCKRTWLRAAREVHFIHSQVFHQLWLWSWKVCTTFQSLNFKLVFHCLPARSSTDCIILIRQISGQISKYLNFEEYIEYHYLFLLNFLVVSSDIGCESCSVTNIIRSDLPEFIFRD